jgi:hypothetical protein
MVGCLGDSVELQLATYSLQSCPPIQRFILWKFCTSYLEFQQATSWIFCNCQNVKATISKTAPYNSPPNGDTFITNVRRTFSDILVLFLAVVSPNFERVCFWPTMLHPTLSYILPSGSKSYNLPSKLKSYNPPILVLMTKYEFFTPLSFFS